VASELAELDAEKHSAVKVQSSLHSVARRFRELAEKFERARFSSQ
jgi:hypothetical protein